jgi:drug/metabolite transporter (DMT)-like permease
MAGADSSATTLIWTAGIGFAIFTLLLPFVFVMPSWSQFGFGLLIGLVSSVPHVLVVLAYRHAPASVLAPFSYTQIVTSTLIGLFFFNATTDVWTMVGAAVIAASGLYSAHRERLRARAKAAAQ